MDGRNFIIRYAFYYPLRRNFNISVTRFEFLSILGEAVVKFPGCLAIFGNFRIKRVGSDGTEVETNKAMRYCLDLIENKFPTMFFVDKVPLKFNITRICANRMNEEEKKIFLNDLRDFPQHVAEAWRNNSASMKSNPNSNNSTPNAKRKNG